MRKLRIVGLGIAIWSLSLWWPEVNKFLTWPVMVALFCGLGLVEIIVWLKHYLQRPHKGNNNSNQPKNGDNDANQQQPTYPATILLAR